MANLEGKTGCAIEIYNHAHELSSLTSAQASNPITIPHWAPDRERPLWTSQDGGVTHCVDKSWGQA